MKRLLVLLLFSSLAFAQQPAPTNLPLTIENIFAEGGITGRGPETIKWSPDGTKVSFVQRDDSGEHGALWYIDTATGNKAVLVSEQKLQSLAPPASSIKDERQKEWATRYNVAAYQWAPDSKHLLFDSRGQLWIYSLDSGTGVQLTEAADPSSDPKFSPDGKRIAYIRKHDLYVRPLDDGDERRLTNSPDDNTLYGEVDWVYAEELAVRSNYFWSPDGRQIVFLEMNEKEVPEYPITDWMPQHPKVDEEKYPKAGDNNPQVRVGVIGSGGGGIKWIKVGDSDDQDIYIPRFGWVRPGLLYVQVLNRNQDKLDLYFVETSSGHSHLMLSETSDAWVDVKHDFRVLKSGDQFLWSSWRDGYTHLYLYSFLKDNPIGADAKLVRQLTKGDWEVGEVSTVDDAAGTVYFTGHADDPRQTQVYSVKLDGSGSMQKVTTDAGSHSPTFSPDAKYFVDNFSALMTPPRLSFCRVGGNCTAVWESRGIATYNLVEPKMLELKAADGSTTLYGSLLLPPNANAAKSVPLILNPYGGPSGQSVRNAWGGTTFLFHQIMAQRGFAILTVDNRGMANRGKAFAVALKHKFGQVELADQLAAMDQVLKQFPQLDSHRLGWWGWSYGGYMTLYALTHSDRFTAGVSVAPVTNWLLYDSIYTERYMGLPKDNPDGYKNSSPVNAAQDLHGHILEVHGTSDDNVHVQNTIQMIEAYIKAGKEYDLQLYPNKTHGIAGKTDRSHLFHRIQEHFERYLMPQEAMSH